MKKICVIGGGPAGMMAAYSASLNENARVLLFEKNEKLGRKLHITGKGRCNITNMGDIDDYMENIPRNSSFMFSALTTFGNYDLVTLFNANGLRTKVERGSRAFPESDKASDVVDFFRALLKKQGVTVNLGKTIERILYSDDTTGFEVFCRNSEVIRADSIIIATGGLSYPLTGATGDGYKIASKMGHSVTKLYPSLVALRTTESTDSLAGLSLKNIAVKICEMSGKIIYEDFGEMLFTHNGVSGPVILSGSARIAERAGAESFKINIDLKPALDEKKLDIRLLNDFNKNKNKDIINALDDLLPRSIIPVIIDFSGIIQHKKVNEITKSERKALVNAIKSFSLTIDGADGFDNAIITRGGISVNEISPKTMESKLIKGLYFAGEVIDVDAYTGGYNLQIAFSTGYLAGKHASESVNEYGRFENGSN